jgi:hypothetical protein
VAVRSSALADPEIRTAAEAMVREYGAKAPLRAIDQLDASIACGSDTERDRWAQVVHAIHVLIRKAPQRPLLEARSGRVG